MAQSSQTPPKCTAPQSASHRIESRNSMYTYSDQDPHHVWMESWLRTGHAGEPTFESTARKRLLQAMFHGMTDISTVNTTRAQIHLSWGNRMEHFQHRVDMLRWQYVRGDCQAMFSREMKEMSIQWENEQWEQLSRLGLIPSSEKARLWDHVLWETLSCVPLSGFQ